MNIFFLSQDPIEAAQMMVDRHVVKMILESAQLLSTAHRVLDGEEVVNVVNNRKKKTAFCGTFRYMVRKKVKK